MTINIITVTYGKRFNLLEKTLDAIISDKNVDKIILVDNGSVNSTEIDVYIKNNRQKKIILVRNKENIGSAGGYKAGILEAKKHVSDYVLLLDDDNVAEDNWSDYFLNILSFFPKRDDIILVGNRTNSNFNLASIPTEKEKRFKISYFNFGKVKNFFLGQKENSHFQPIIYMPHGAYGYGGALLPFKAIRETEPPFEPFYLYADDTEYLYRISKNGYKAYQLSRPVIRDIDQTFSDLSSYLMAFDKNVSLIKLFFMTRNQYALALMTESQTKLSIILNGVFGTSIKIAYAFIKLGINKFTIERSKILILAFYDGVRLNFSNEKNIKKYTRL